jgi:hypothetical protein
MAQSQRVAQYNSDTEDETETIQEIPVSSNKRSKQNRKKWINFRTYEGKDQAMEKINSDGIWSISMTNITGEGKRVYYRCNQVKKRSKQCPVAIHLLYHNDNESVTMFITTNEHVHDQPRTTGIDEVSKSEICELFKMKFKPKRILEILAEKSLPIPTKQQLSNYISNLKNVLYGNVTISLGGLESWCRDNNSVPDDNDTPWVLAYEIEYQDEIGDEYDVEDDDEGDDEESSKFRFFVTTKRLLANTMLSNRIHADATYKLIWHGFPCLVIGTTDMDKHFHPYGFAVCSNEKQKDFEFVFNSLQEGATQNGYQMQTKELVLIADGSEAIRNAFTKVFGDENNVVMCWAHMKRCIDKKMHLVEDKNSHLEIMQDIETMQISRNSKQFQIATQLFLKKWKNESSFLEYFSNEWLLSKNGWHEGVQMYAPSTNNALEAVNRIIKDEYTLRERLVLSRFTVVVFDIVRKWSKERDPSNINAKIYKQEPTIQLKNWTDAYEWAKSKKEVISISSNNETRYYIPAGETVRLTDRYVNRYENGRFNTFDTFKSAQFGIWRVTLPHNTEEWRKGICTCPSFLKCYICKHIIGMSIRLKYCKPPPEAKNVEIGRKRKRGRPAKAKKALLKQ